MDDSKIIELYMERSEQAISETSKKYGRYCHYIAYSILHNDEDSEECVNDTYLRAWNSIPPKRPSKLQTFLGKITRNLSLNKWEKLSAEKRGAGQTSLILDELSECIPAEQDAVNTVENMVIRDVLDRFLDELPAETRKIFVRRYFYMSPVKEIADEYGLLIIADNTFLTPYFQKPLTLGADLVVHSGTKFLGGHNDVLAGFVCIKGKGLSEKLRYTYKTVGCCLPPFDSFLVLRGIKTLSVRLERQQENAKKIALWLKDRPEVKAVYYTGLPEHPGYEINQKQASGCGSMISFKVDSEKRARKLLESVKLISYAESLGGVESLITYPMLQTHGDVPVETRERLGITEDFLRMSVGIENAEDLIADLEQALAE